jgi:hypothetical protein
VKKFLAGILSGLAVSFCVTVFASQTPQVISQAVAKKIDAYFGRVKLLVNGKNVDKETLVYDDSTYIPLRDAAEVLGVEVEWDEKTATAILTSAGSGTAPASASQSAASTSAGAAGTGSTQTTPTVVSTKSANSTSNPTTATTTGTSSSAPTTAKTSGTAAPTQSNATSVSTSRS